MAQALGISRGTAQSRTHTLQQQGKIAPQPRGGVPISGRRPRRGRCKHTVQSRAGEPLLTPEDARTEAESRGLPPSRVVQETLWPWLAAQKAR
jgi:hypothetical protein